MARFLRLRATALLAVAAACAPTKVPTIGAAPGTFAPQDDEARLWENALVLERRIARETIVYQDSALDAYLTAVARRVAAPSLDTATFPLRVRVVRDPQPNAFALPHGVMYLHTGMLALMDNESQLATVLGHELTHITHRHAIRQLRDARNKNAIAQVFSTVTSIAGATVGGFGIVLGGLTGSMGDLWVVTAVSGYSRELEAEADQRGLESMARAGYDECEAPRVFEHFVASAQTSRAQESYLYSTHPRLMVRLGNYLNLLGPRCANGARDSTPPRPDDYTEHIAVLVLDNAALNYDLGRMEPAEAGVKRHLQARPASPRGHFLRGQIARRRFETAQAIAAYEEAARLAPRYADPQRELGLLYRQLRRSDEARAALQRYLDLAPAAPDAATVGRQLAELEEP